MADQEKDIFHHIRQDPEESLGLAAAILAREALSLPVSRIDGGSQLLFAVGDKFVLKVFNPVDTAFCHTEAVFLDGLYGRLPVATPRLHNVGCHGGYPYLIMGAMTGMPLVRLWKAMAIDERREVLCQVGYTTRALHSLPVTPFLTASTEWHAFIDRQRSHLADHHREFGLDEQWISDICAYVDATNMDFHVSSQLVVLHTELMLEHLFVQREKDVWSLSGLIDYEPSMVGLRDYEFCSVGLFLSRGNRDLFRSFLISYGMEAGELSERLSRRIMTLLLLHRYCNLKWFLSLVPGPLALDRCVQLERYWFSC